MGDHAPQHAVHVRLDPALPIRVLLVEDDEASARAMRQALGEEAAGIAITHVVDAASALSLARRQAFDLALVDLSLSQGTGEEGLACTKEVLRVLPVVVIAERAHEELALAALRYGAQDYVCKQEIEPRELVRTARHALERHCLRAQLLEARRREHHMATHDVLTGLPNRHWLDEYLGRMLAGAHRRGTKLAVLFLDLDGFKRVNDTLGHRAGDELLKQAAKRLLDTSRRSDAITRLGGDEFIVMITDFTDHHVPGRVAEKVLETLARPFRIEGTDQWLTASIGIAVAPSDAEHADELVRRADIAMYEAKAEGRNRYLFYRSGLNDEVAERAELVRGLREALEKDQLVLHYQPQIDVLLGDALGAEALVRWRHPTRGMVSPAEFIPIAEEAGLMGPIGAWVLDRALREQQRWAERGHDHMRISVNASAQQLSRVGFADEVSAFLAEHRVGAGALEIEITESTALSEGDLVRTNLRALRALGIRVALDDFGTGYSSLTLLQKLRVDTLKIDRSFVSTLASDPTTQVIVNSLIHMAAGLGISPLAEGVEQLVDVEQLVALGCHRVQGYLLGKPMEGSDLLACLEAPRPPWEETLEPFRGRGR